jgi:hypothetical protein
MKLRTLHEIVNITVQCIISTLLISMSWDIQGYAAFQHSEPTYGRNVYLIV